MNTVLIGATSGLGREIAYLIAKQNNNNLLISSRDADELKKLQSDIKVRYNSNSKILPVDLSKFSSLNKYIDEINLSFKIIDCLIITAGYTPDLKAEYHDNKILDKTVMTNYLGVVRIVNSISNQMKKNENGKIICISSVAGERGRKKNFIYGSAKSALTTYLEGLENKLYQYNVSVTNVMLGWIDTPMSYGLVNKNLVYDTKKTAKKIISLINIKKNKVYIPYTWKFIMFVIRMIPNNIFRRLNI